MYLYCAFSFQAPRILFHNLLISSRIRLYTNRDFIRVSIDLGILSFFFIEEVSISRTSYLPKRFIYLYIYIYGQLNCSLLMYLDVHEWEARNAVCIFRVVGLVTVSKGTVVKLILLSGNNLDRVAFAKI